MKRTVTAFLTSLLLLLQVGLFAQAQSALRLGLESQVTNTIIFGNSTATPVSSGVSVSFSASDSVLPSSNTNIFLPATPFSTGFRINSGSFVYMRGNQQYLRAWDTLDLGFNPRVSCDELDIGAYESVVVRTRITVQPTLATERICEGGTMALQVTAVGENLSFQWQKNNENIVGQISPTLTITNVSASDAGYYRVIVFGDCCGDTSDIVRLDVDQTPWLVVMSDTLIYSGQDVTLRILEYAGTVTWYESDMQTVVDDTVLTNITETMRFVAIARSGVCAESVIRSVQITVRELPCYVRTPRDTTICNGEPFMLRVDSISVVYRWFIAGTTDELSSFSTLYPTETLTLVLVGYYANNEICGTDTLVLTVPVITFDVRADGLFCNDYIVWLYSTPPADAWLDEDGNLVGRGNTPLIPPTGVTTAYTAQFVELGCTVQQQVLITTNPPVLYSLWGDSIDVRLFAMTVCEGDSVRLQTNVDPALVVWERLSNGEILGNNPVFIAVSDTFRAHAQDYVCGNIYVDVIVNVQPRPYFQIISDGSVCEGIPTFLMSVPNATHWRLLDETLVTMPITLQTSQTFVGIFMLDYCEVRDTITLSVDQNPRVVVMSDTTLNYGSDITLEIIDYFGTVTWYESDMQTIVQNTALTNLTETVEFVAIARNGVCADAVARVTLTVREKTDPDPGPGPGPDPGPDPEPEPEPEVSFGRRLPTLFITPNNDGINDYLYIQGIEQHPRNTVTIINSQGQIIITIENFDNQDRRWDGRDERGRAIPDGVYYYILTVDGMRPMAGTVVVRLSSRR